jgi:hypothetical protein
MPLLSHYTSRAGLEGIARTGTLWATDFISGRDTAEYFYGWDALQRAAYRYAFERIPEDMRNAATDIEALSRGSTQQFRSLLTGTDGYGHLYMTSFARGTKEDHDKRGILTIWERYTQHQGYCLQFERGDVEHMMRLETSKGNYDWVNMCEVKYGTEEDTWSFRALANQLGEQFLLQAARSRDGHRIPVKFEDHWAPTYLLRRIMDYCGSHKDPCYEDEREFRIFAYPSTQSEARVLTGIASRKTLKAHNGRRYLALGEFWRPPIAPKRIIIGIRADPNIEHIVAQFASRPEIAHANLPVALS